MSRNEKQCGKYKHWQSFYMAYDCDPHEPTDLGFCSKSGKQDKTSHINDNCKDFEFGR